MNIKINKDEQPFMSELINSIPDKNLNKFFQDFMKLLDKAQGDDYENFDF